MKCPKCGYLGFETGDRCRNCGYDFSLPGLTGSNSDPDLTVNTGGEEDEPPLDLALDKEFDVPLQRSATRGLDHGLDFDRLIGAPEPALPPEPSPAPSEEFPLFPVRAHLEDEALARPRAVPRPPLAVRRATPEVPRVRPRQTPRAARSQAYDTPPLVGLGLSTIAETDRFQGPGDAPPVRRIAAAVIDLAVLGMIDAAVVYFTLRMSGLDFGDITLLPGGPLAGFFLLLNGGYFATFAAVGGQTIGQMLFGLKVVSEDGTPLAFGRATLRTLAWLIFTVPLGLGLWFALGADRRTLHDRLTATRVVRS